MRNKLLRVIYHGRLVGRLAETPQKVLAFEYDAEWLRDGFSISPFHLPLEKRVFIANRDPFDGNFGVFNDSLPDGWGRLLIDRMLVDKGINPFSVSTLDRLAIVGSSGMGALEYKPEKRLTDAEAVSDLDTLAKETVEILKERGSREKLAELVKIGGSSGGARPKVLLKINGEHWLVKFRSREDSKSIGKLEFKYMQAAKAAGLIAPETKLLEGRYFGVKRFDRKSSGEKVFMISAGGLLDVSHRMPVSDYNHLMNATFDLIRDKREVEKMFRLMCFNVFAHNRDDHARNFSFLYDNGKWQVSPVYDLVYNAGMGLTKEHATMINGNGRNPTEEDILSVAKKADISERRAKEIMEEVKSAVKKARLVNGRL
jgi:serine/threonine-protein kinase HipA